MKKIFFFILFISMYFTNYSQNSKLDTIIGNHINRFRENIDDDDNIFIESYYDFLNNNIPLNENDFVLLTYIDPKKLKRRASYYLIRFIITSKDNKFKLNAVNFKIEKVSNKEIKLINLLNGDSYELN